MPFLLSPNKKLVTLGNKLAHQGTLNLQKVPQAIFADILFKERIALEKGRPITRRSYEEASSIFYHWVLAKYGSVNVDTLFLDWAHAEMTVKPPRVSTRPPPAARLPLLLASPRAHVSSSCLQEIFPNLPDHGQTLGKDRRWWTILRNRFPSGRRTSAKNMYKTQKMAFVDLCDDAKKLVAKGLPVNVDQEATAMFTADVLAVKEEELDQKVKDDRDKKAPRGRDAEVPSDSSNDDEELLSKRAKKVSCEPRIVARNAARNVA